MTTNLGKALLIIFAMAMSFSAQAVDRKTLVTYAASLEGKKGKELKNAVYQLVSNKKVLSYGSQGSKGTWWGFWYTDRVESTNECRNRYSQAKFYFSGHTGASIAGMNIEHSFPKSWWGGTKNDAYKDLYNLYPSDAKANSDKSNYPMGVVTNGLEKSGAGFGKIGTGQAGNQTVKMWEPGDTYKGEFSRSYLYMATAYQNLSWVNVGLQTLETGDYPTLKKWASDLYLKWSRADKVDQVEIDRNNAVAKIQNNRNLFVDYPYLAEYIWGDSMNVAFNPAQSISTAEDDSRYLSQNPPVNKVATPTFSISSGRYTAPISVSITTTTAGAEIFYTTDGNQPTAQSQRYVSPINITENTTLQAVAVLGSETSAIAQAVYTFAPQGVTFVFKQITTQPTDGKRYLIVAESGGQKKAAKPAMPSGGKNYAYLTVEDVQQSGETITLTDDVLAFTFESAGSGFKIKDSAGKYYYQDGKYTSFIPTDDASLADIWQVEVNGDKTFTIKASDSGQIIQYAEKYKSFGNYSEAKATNINPLLFEETTITNGVANIETTEKTQNGKTYTLQGIEVDASRRLPAGVYVRNGRKFIIK